LRVLIDESLTRILAAELPGHDVFTVRQQRWTGLRNGVLLRAAADAGFGVLITAEQSFPYQQDLRAIGIAVVIVRGTSNRMADLRPLVPEILMALRFVRPGDVVEVARRDSVRDRVCTQVLTHFGAARTMGT
jgi:hypothetical protein